MCALFSTWLTLLSLCSSDSYFSMRVADSDIPWQKFLDNGTAIFDWVNGQQRLRLSTLGPHGASDADISVSL